MDVVAYLLEMKTRIFTHDIFFLMSSRQKFNYQNIRTERKNSMNAFFTEGTFKSERPFTQYFIQQIFS